VARIECQVTLDAEGKLVLKQQGETITTFRSKAIVLTNGGSQAVHPQFFTPEWFQGSILPEKVVTSDFFLKREGFMHTLNKLNSLYSKAERTIKKKRKPLKIVIIGGSHSGFSCAWMLLNGPANP